MKRLTAVLTALIWLCLPRVTAFAEAGRLTMTCVPPTERGTVFYLDISYSGTLSAAMLELDYDGALTEYRSVSAAADTTTVKAKAQGGTLRIVLGDADCVGGRLCRVSFKALGSGTAAFTLRMTEGVDGELDHIALPPACSLKADLSTAGGSGASGDNRRSSYRGSGSNKSGDVSDDSATGDEEPARTVLDLRDPDRENKNLIVIGAAVGTAAALLVIFGFLLGWRARKKKKPAEDSGGEEEL